MSMSQLPALLTVSEVSILAGVARSTVVRWTKSGQLASTKTPGGHIRVFTHQPFLLSLIANRGTIDNR